MAILIAKDFFLEDLIRSVKTTEDENIILPGVNHLGEGGGGIRNTIIEKKNRHSPN